MLAPIVQRLLLLGIRGVAIVFLANFLNDHAVPQLQQDALDVEAVESDASQAAEVSSSGLDRPKAEDRISDVEATVADGTRSAAPQSRDSTGGWHSA